MHTGIDAAHISTNPLNGGVIATEDEELCALADALCVDTPVAAVALLGDDATTDELVWLGTTLDLVLVGVEAMLDVVFDFDKIDPTSPGPLGISTTFEDVTLWRDCAREISQPSCRERLATRLAITHHACMTGYSRELALQAALFNGTGLSVRSNYRSVNLTLRLH
jgi:hypothetical protein